MKLLTFSFILLFGFIAFTNDVFADICDSGCVPLTDMQAGQTYYGQNGGLYGNYQNTPPASHVTKINEAISQITPLDNSGQPSPNGKIVILTNGMSNTAMKSNAFISQAENDPTVSSKIEIVNGARGSIFAYRWAENYQDQWGTYVINQINSKGVTPNQVQVVWMEHANGASQGECGNCLAGSGEYVATLTDNLKTIAKEIRTRFPNVKVIFMSNRSYGGYALVDLNDEPFAYENAFAVRNVILDQILGTQSQANDVNYTNAPVLIWGPYLWSDDGKPNSQGLSWEVSDFSSTDGTHPVQNVPGKGAEKAGSWILNFFKTSPFTASWFTESGGGVTATPNPTATGMPTSTPPTTKVGDFDNDGDVDILDRNAMLSSFNPNSIGDYNKVVVNFGI